MRGGPSSLANHRVNTANQPCVNTTNTTGYYTNRTRLPGAVPTTCPRLSCADSCVQSDGVPIRASLDLWVDCARFGSSGEPDRRCRLQLLPGRDRGMPAARTAEPPLQQHQRERLQGPRGRGPRQGPDLNTGGTRRQTGPPAAFFSFMFFQFPPRRTFTNISSYNGRDCYRRTGDAYTNNRRTTVGLWGSPFLKKERIPTQPWRPPSFTRVGIRSTQYALSPP